MMTKLCIRCNPLHLTYESELDKNIFLPLFMQDLLKTMLSFH